MSLRVMIVDDEPYSLEELRQDLAVFPYVTVAACASGGEEAIACLQLTPVDLVFLDIEMDGINGFDLARNIQSAFPDVLIVFQTGHVDFALDGYEYKPLDFIVKPVNLARLERVLLRARELIERDERRTPSPVRIGLPVDGGMEIIQVGQVIYIEKLGRQTFLVQKDGSRLAIHESLQKLQDIFEPYGFYRCHQSFLVQLAAIRSIRLDPSKNSYNVFFSDTDVCAPVSRGKYRDLRNRLASDGLAIY